MRPRVGMWDGMGWMVWMGWDGKGWDGWIERKKFNPSFHPIHPKLGGKGTFLVKAFCEGFLYLENFSAGKLARVVMLIF